MFLNLKIKDNECYLLYYKEKLVDVLTAGDFFRINFAKKYRVVHLVKTSHLFLEANADKLWEEYENILSKQIFAVNTERDQLALVYYQNQIINVVESNSQKFFWKSLKGQKVEIVELKDSLKIEDSLARELNVYNSKYVQSVNVPAQCKAMVYIDGKHTETLNAGAYYYWKVAQRLIEVKVIETRLQNIEVQGQEILTADKVTIRINLSASYRIVDVVKMMETVKSFDETFYRELQLALRRHVANRTLDELLNDRDGVSTEVENQIRNTISQFGVQLVSLGLRDIILTGEMRDLMNKVVEAEKEAQANIIRRREETSATRSLHNTARMMENNPILLRLKELEILEKISSKVQNLEVYNGFNGVMNDLIKLRSND